MIEMMRKSARHAPTKGHLIGLALFILAFAMIGSVFAQSVTGLDIPWWTIAGGGGTSSGGGYTLNGSIGQPDAGRLTGGVYTLNGGFWVLPAPIISPPGSVPLRNYFTIAGVPLTWNSVTDAAGYHVQVAREAAFTHMVFEGDTTTQLTITTDPLTSGRYYWRVCAKNGSDVCGAWSAVDSFTVSVP